MIKTTILGLLAFLVLSATAKTSDENAINTSKPDKVDRLNIISWNVEHLAQDNHQGCKPRTENDYQQLKTFARSINADIIALQEVESKQAVHRILPASEWNVEISNRANSKPYECRQSKKTKKTKKKSRWSTQQKVAIAIRKDIRYQRQSDFTKLGLDVEGLRVGVQIKIQHSQQKFDLLALHLKSGCFVDNYARSRKEACHILAKQAAILDAWVENRAKNNKGFILLGDFNHRISAPYNTLWRDLNYIGNQPLELYNNMRDQLNCHPYYPAPIDHILISKQLSQSVVVNSQQVYYYPHKGKMKKRDMLSDHCPIGVELAF